MIIYSKSYTDMNGEKHSKGYMFYSLFSDWGVQLKLDRISTCRISLNTHRLKIKQR